jgi:hypothetical protein
LPIVECWPALAPTLRRQKGSEQTPLRFAQVAATQSCLPPRGILESNHESCVNHFSKQRLAKTTRYCVIFVSKDYRDRVWTSHELRSAQARAVQEKGSEYILPIRIDDTELDGLLPTVGYVPISMGIAKFSGLLISKLRS